MNSSLAYCKRENILCPSHNHFPRPDANTTCNSVIPQRLAPGRGFGYDQSPTPCPSQRCTYCEAMQTFDLTRARAAGSLISRCCVAFLLPRNCQAFSSRRWQATNAEVRRPLGIKEASKLRFPRGARVGCRGTG